MALGTMKPYVFIKVELEDDPQISEPGNWRIKNWHGNIDDIKEVVEDHLEIKVQITIRYEDSQ